MASKNSIAYYVGVGVFKLFISFFPYIHVQLELSYMTTSNIWTVIHFKPLRHRIIAKLLPGTWIFVLVYACSKSQSVLERARKLFIASGEIVCWILCRINMFDTNSIVTTNLTLIATTQTMGFVTYHVEKRSLTELIQQWDWRTRRAAGFVGLRETTVWRLNLAL